jgi:hypothetical protein
MHGAVLEHRSFTPPTPDWDHEHCVLCQRKFTVEPQGDSIQEGYVHGYDRSAAMPPVDERRNAAPPEAPPGFDVVITAPTMEEWVCPDCFDDFRERFGWTAVAPSGT